MTYEERIQILDNGIIRMSTYLSYGAAYNDHLDSTGNEAKREAYDVLTKIEATRASLYAVKNISFDSCRRNMWGCNHNTVEVMQANKCNAYIQCINSIINILNQERTRLIKEQANEEQKSNKLLTKWTLAFSIIAALGTIASLLFTIFSYFYNL
jgi:hypothetical protein